MKKFTASILQHPLNTLYSIILLTFAICSTIPAFYSGAWDSALVNLTMAVLLIQSMWRKTAEADYGKPGRYDRFAAWIIGLSANCFAFIPLEGFSGSLLQTAAFMLLFWAFILYFSGHKLLLKSLIPALWCCVFMPFHEEFMLMASYPLRLSATMLSAFILKITGMEVVYSGSSLHLTDLNIAITDACSGINQLDAFVLTAYIAIRMLHQKFILQLLHIAFIIPSIIIANTMRIVLTVWLYELWGTVILEKFWHITLGYVQLLMAFLIFIAVGRLFKSEPKKTEEEKS